MTTEGPSPPAEAPSWLARLLPGLVALRRYDRKQLPSDVGAGLVLTAFLIPVGMGYAQAAGLSPVTGLYATILPLLCYALFGPSRVMVLGPDSSLAAVIFAVIAPMAMGDATRAHGLAAMLALFTGVIIAAAGALKLGFVTELLSRPVQLGYLAAVAVVIVAAQLPKLMGFSSEGDDLVEQLAELVGGIRGGRVNLHALLVGGAGLGTIVVLRRFAPRVPGSLIAVLLGIGMTIALELDDHGVRIVGQIPQGLPSAALVPISFAEAVNLAKGAMAIALIAVADTTVLSQSLASKLDEEVDPDQELVALGAANVAAGLFGGFPVSSSASRTPVAIAAGAKSQITNVVGALMVGLTIVAAPFALEKLPQPVLSAVVLVAAYGLVELGALRKLVRWSRTEFGLFLFTFLAVAALGVTEGIVFAIGLSLADFVRRAWRPHDAVLARVPNLKGYHDTQRFAEHTTLPGLVLYRFDAPLFFANAATFRRRVKELSHGPGPVQWIVIAAEPITTIDTTAAEMLLDLCAELEARGVELLFAELKDPVKDRLKRYGLFSKLGEEAFFPTLGTAVAAFKRASGREDPPEDPPDSR